MIRDLSILYTVDHVSVTLSTDIDGENTPYNLAEIFARVVRDSNANEEMVIEQLKIELGL